MLEFQLPEWVRRGEGQAYTPSGKWLSSVPREVVALRDYMDRSPWEWIEFRRTGRISETFFRVARENLGLPKLGRIVEFVP